MERDGAGRSDLTSVSCSLHLTLGRWRKWRDSRGRFAKAVERGLDRRESEGFPMRYVGRGYLRRTSAIISTLAAIAAVALIGCSNRSHPPATYREARGSAACRSNCAGHEAGWRWAQSHRIADVALCSGRSQSFREGCGAYVRDAGRFLGPSAPPANSRPSFADDLEDCSPFAHLDGRQLLAFNSERGTVARGDDDGSSDSQVTLSIVLDDAAAGRRDSGATPVTSVSTGTFIVNAATKRVVVTFPEGIQDFTLLTPMPLDQDGVCACLR